ncbi:hypothetical protein EJ08DRAFT_733554 [Tothia fuscella]|uniref:Uncharacterized protein n=1 Tax=Tothia fuscella TaxID=1048955 RepID=A0A9P4NRX9_9PEZI|nr:hypothetical protein EJ08DRAFT_733554 [Tothia fuscella]
MGNAQSGEACKEPKSLRKTKTNEQSPEVSGKEHSTTGVIAPTTFEGSAGRDRRSQLVLRQAIRAELLAPENVQAIRAELLAPENVQVSNNEGLSGGSENKSIDMQSALSFLQQLKKTATPEDLRALRDALSGTASFVPHGTQDSREEVSWDATPENEAPRRLGSSDMGRLVVRNGAASPATTLDSLDMLRKDGGPTAWAVDRYMESYMASQPEEPEELDGAEEFAYSQMASQPEGYFDTDPQVQESSAIVFIMEDPQQPEQRRDSPETDSTITTDHPPSPEQILTPSDGNSRRARDSVGLASEYISEIGSQSSFSSSPVFSYDMSGWSSTSSLPASSHNSVARSSLRFSALSSVGSFARSNSYHRGPEKPERFNDISIRSSLNEIYELDAASDSQRSIGVDSVSTVVVQSSNVAQAFDFGLESIPPHPPLNTDSGYSSTADTHRVSDDAASEFAQSYSSSRNHSVVDLSIPEEDEDDERVPPLSRKLSQNMRKVEKLSGESLEYLNYPIIGNKSPVRMRSTASKATQKVNIPRNNRSQLKIEKITGESIESLSYPVVGVTPQIQYDTRITLPLDSRGSADSVAAGQITESEKGAKVKRSKSWKRLKKEIVHKAPSAPGLKAASRSNSPERGLSEMESTTVFEEGVKAKRSKSWKRSKSEPTQKLSSARGSRSGSRANSPERDLSEKEPAAVIEDGTKLKRSKSWIRSKKEPLKTVPSAPCSRSGSRSNSLKRGSSVKELTKLPKQRKKLQKRRWESKDLSATVLTQSVVSIQTVGSHFEKGPDDREQATVELDISESKQPTATKSKMSSKRSSLVMDSPISTRTASDLDSQSKSGTHAPAVKRRPSFFSLRGRPRNVGPKDNDIELTDVVAVGDLGTPYDVAMSESNRKSLERTRSRSAGPRHPHHFVNLAKPLSTEKLPTRTSLPQQAVAATSDSVKSRNNSARNSGTFLVTRRSSGGPTFDPLTGEPSPEGTLSKRGTLELVAAMNKSLPSQLPPELTARQSTNVLAAMLSQSSTESSASLPLRLEEDMPAELSAESPAVYFNGTSYFSPPRANPPVLGVRPSPSPVPGARPSSSPATTIFSASKTRPALIFTSASPSPPPSPSRPKSAGNLSGTWQHQRRSFATDNNLRLESSAEWTKQSEFWRERLREMKLLAAQAAAAKTEPLPEFFSPQMRRDASKPQLWDGQPVPPLPVTTINVRSSKRLVQTPTMNPQAFNSAMPWQKPGNGRYYPPVPAPMVLKSQR